MSDIIKASKVQLPAFLKDRQKGSVDAFRGGIKQGLPLPVLSIRGRSWRMRHEGEENILQSMTIPVVLLTARSTLSKRLFEGPWDPAEPQAPICASADAIHPDVVDPESENCVTCPMNQWGSRITLSGKPGKMCSDYKRLIVWVVGMDKPMILDLPSTSLRVSEADKGKGFQMLTEYANAIDWDGLDINTVVTKLAFTNAEFPQVTMSLERFVTEEEMARIDELSQLPEVQQALESTVDSEGTMRVVDTPELEKSSTGPVEDGEDVKSFLSKAQKEKTKETAPPVDDSTEATPPAEEEDMSEEDISAELNKMLEKKKSK